MSVQEQLDQFCEEGYCIVDDALDPTMLAPMQSAARRIRDKVHSGRVNVFTHWANNENTDPLAIRGLLAPAFDEPIFAQYLISEPVMAYNHALLGAQLQLGSIILFTNPQHRDWSHAWHRDFDTENLDLSPEVEMEILNQRRKDPRWHLALVDDACLQLVPGSHRRYRNKAEHECLTSKCHEDLPDQHTIALKAGQAVFWDTYTIHRGVMKKDIERLCLNCGWSLHLEDAPPQETAARLQWRLAPEVRAFLPAAMRPYYDRWRALQLG